MATQEFPQRAHWQIGLGDGYAEALDDLRQSIAIILRTRRGSDPLRPEFGSDIWRYLDYPIDRARAHVVREAVDALRQWEPRVNLEDIGADYGSGPHPAFIVDGQIKDGLWIGVHPGTVRNGELLWLPGVAPTVNQPYTYFVDAARAAGPGFHVMTNAEWAAVAMWCAKNGWYPRGNTNHGRARNALWETGTRVDGSAAWTSAATASGPRTSCQGNATSSAGGIACAAYSWDTQAVRVTWRMCVTPSRRASRTCATHRAGALRHPCSMTMFSRGPMNISFVERSSDA